MAEYREPAFPVPDTERNYFQGGMTLRQWYAGMALSGLVSSRDASQAYILVELAFKLADEMLAYESQPFAGVWNRTPKRRSEQGLKD